MPDGSVEMELEGRENDIDEVILTIERRDYIRIENIEVKDIPLEGSHSFEYR